MNDQWQPQFIANAEITNKQFTIKDFAVYMNVDLSADGGYWKAILCDDLTLDWKEKDADAKYKRFLKQECSFEKSSFNSYLIERFCLQARVSLNKNVRNKKPQVWAHAVLGGDFIAGRPDHIVTSEFGKYFYFSIQQ